MTETVYGSPECYEIAFSFRDISAEVDVFERCCEMFAQLSVRKVLEIGCGNSPHMNELLKRGYRYTGLDNSEAMIEYSRAKASVIEGKAKIIQADMLEFSFPETFDFAFITLGSLYARSTTDVISHFRSVARALKSGGLYLMDWCVHFSPIVDLQDTWTIEHEGIKVTTSFSEEYTDAVEQLVKETIALEVEDHGTISHLLESGVKRVIFPQEFLRIIEQTGDLEFVGWWNNWDLQEPLSFVKDSGSIERPIVLLRRK